MRRHVGTALLAASILLSLADIAGWLKPSLLRMRAHGGYERTAAFVLGSLSLKAVLLLAGGLLAFWPEQDG